MKRFADWYFDMGGWVIFTILGGVVGLGLSYIRRGWLYGLLLIIAWITFMSLLIIWYR